MQVKDTNQRRRRIVVLALSCAVLQLAIAPNIPLFSGRANFAFIFGACIALSQGGAAGVIAGFLSGLFFDLCATSPVGLMALLCTLSCYSMGSGVRNRFAEDSSESLRIFLMGDLAVNVLYGLAMLLVGDASNFFEVLFLRSLPSAVLTFIFFLPFMALMSRSVGSKLFGRGGSSYISPAKPGIRLGGRR